LNFPEAGQNKYSGEKTSPDYTFSLAKKNYSKTGIANKK